MPLGQVGQCHVLEQEIEKFVTAEFEDKVVHAFAFVAGLALTSTPATTAALGALQFVTGGEFLVAGEYVFVAAIEPKFFGELLRLAEVSDIDPLTQFDQSTWPAQLDAFTRTFAAKTRDEWTDIFDGTDACVAPVLSLVSGGYDSSVSMPRRMAS